MSFLFADKTRKNKDPWWQFVNTVELFNNNTKETILASSIMI